MSRFFRWRWFFINWFGIWRWRLSGMRRQVGAIRQAREIAHTHFIHKRRDQALDLAWKTLTDAEATIGKHHPETLHILETLAMTYEDPRADQSDIDDEKAAELYERLLVGCERVYGKTNQYTVRIVENLGKMYSNLHRYDEAEALAKRAIAGYKPWTGESGYPEMYAVYLLASIYIRAERYEEAEPVMRRVLEQSEKFDGVSHAMTMHHVNRMAVIYAGQRRFAEAAVLFWRGIDGQRWGWPGEIVDDTAESFVKRGQRENAVHLLRAMLDFVTPANVPNLDAVQLRIYNKYRDDLAALYREMGRRAEAEALLRDRPQSPKAAS